MSINDRIKMVRKDLGLTQEDFGQALGVSRSVIKNIEYNTVDATTKPLLLTSICTTFGISRKWLDTGEGSKTAETVDSYVDEVCQRLKLNDFGKKALLAYLQLSESEQNALAKFAELMVAGENTSGYIEMISAARGGKSNNKKIATDAETVVKLDTLPDKSHDFD